MKKFLPYILIFFIVVQLFAPFTVGTGVKNNIAIQKNTVRAAEKTLFVYATQNDNSPVISVVGSLKMLTSEEKQLDGASVLYFVSTKETFGGIKVKENDLSLSPAKVEGEYTTYNISTEKINNYSDDTTVANTVIGVEYYVKIVIIKDSVRIDSNVVTINPGTSETYDQDLIPGGNAGAEGGVKPGNPGALPACEGFLNPLPGGGTFMGCVAQAFYYVFFATTSAVFAIAGKALDFTLYYSISDMAYRSEFVTSGWGVVKDFSNIFFIFVLLYIAFGTILNLHSVKTKEMIINVVIIGLLINFSLFTTQVIIDASNILARVFYNDKTIIITQKDENGESTKVTSVLGDYGELQLSTAIVSGVNPQNLIINSREISRVKPASSGFDTGDTDVMTGDIPLTSFFLIVFLATIVNIVGIIAFTSTALIFIGRVVMLWLSMIVAPLAFFSYIVPQMQGIKMIGWKEWWPNLLKMAFVAPVFVFFMYLIIGFMGKGLGVMDAFKTPGGISVSGLSFVIKIIVPFAFIMILLMKAKDIAVSMSGEIGASLSKAGGVVGGLAVGAMTGGAALAMRGTVGRLGSAVASSDRLKAMEEKGGPGGFAAKMLLKTGTAAGKGSFDARATKAGAAAGKSLGVDLGKAKEGGFAKVRAEHVEKRQKRAKELEVGEDSKLKQDFYAAQNKLDAEKSSTTNQKEISTKTTNLATEEKALVSAERDLVKAERALKDAIDNKMGKAAISAATGNRDTEVGKRDRQVKKVDDAKDELKEAEKSIKDAEKNVKLAENAIISKNRTTRENYAASNRGGWSQAVNFVVSGGQHSFRGEREASNKILAGIKDEKK